MKNKEFKEKFMVVTAFQTACFGIIVLIAKFVGDWIYNVIVKTVSVQWLVLIIIISILDFFELTNNWVSIKKYFDQYDGLLFSIDVVTLGCFFWQIYILSNLGEVLFGKEVVEIDELKQQIVWVIVISYALIFALYAIWNYIILHSNGKNKKPRLNEDDEKKFRSSMRGRIIQVIHAVVFIFMLAYFGANNIFFIHLIVCGLLCCIGYVVKHNHDFKNFQGLIGTKGQD